MLRIALVLVGLSSASAFAPGALPALSASSQRLALTCRRSTPLGLRMEDNSFLKNVPKPKTLKSVGLSDDARAKVDCLLPITVLDHNPQSHTSSPEAF